MKDLGQCQTFLGIEISRNRKDRTIHLCQKSYVEKVLQVGMESATGKTKTHGELPRAYHVGSYNT
jgi:hypothetical protein